MSRLRTLTLPLLLILLGFGLRTLRLGEAAVWWDEGWSFWNARQPLADLTSGVAHDSHPPLYQWALHGWMQVAGSSEFALRWPSVLAGTLTVAAAWALGRRLGGSRRAAALAGLLVALSAFHIQWSQEIRMYAFPALFATLAAYATVRAWDDERIRWWALLVLAGAAAPLSHYLGGLVLLILNAHWLMMGRARSRTFHRRWIAAMLAIGLIVGAWLAYALPRIRGGGGEVEVSLGALFRLMLTLLAVNKSTDLDRYAPVTLAVCAVLAAGWLVWARREWTRASLIALVVLLPPVAVLLLAMPWTDLFAPPPSARYFVIFVPLILAGGGVGLDRLLAGPSLNPSPRGGEGLHNLFPSPAARGKGRGWGPAWRALSAAAVIGVVLVYGWTAAAQVAGRHYRDDYASLIAAAALLAGPDEPVFFLSDDRYPLVDYYWQRAATDRQPAFEPQGLTAPPTSAEIDTYAARTFAGIDRFWLIQIEAHLGDPTGDLRAWIDAHYTRVYITIADYNLLSLYALDPASAAPNPPTILAPADRDLRAGDRARIGVPGGTTVTLSRGDQVVAEQVPEQWALVEFPIYQAYPPGAYTLRAGDESYPLRVTGSLPEWDDAPDNVNARIGPLRLVGYWLWELPAGPGESFTVTLYWQVEAPAQPGLTAFVHLLGPTNPADGSTLWDVADGLPANTPPDALGVGLRIADRRTIHIPETMPPGWTSLEVGLYRLDTLERVVLADGTDRVLIPGIEVRHCTRILGQCVD